MTGLFPYQREIIERVRAAGVSGERVKIIVNPSQRLGRTFSMEQHWRRPSSRMWMRMMRTSNYDRRKMKRMWRLIEEGR